MKYLFTLLLSLFFFALTYASAPMEFTATDLGFIVCLLAIVLTVQLAISHVFVRYRVVQNLILAGFATINILYLNLVLNAAFMGLPRYTQALALLLALFILFTFMNMLDEDTRIARVLPVLFALATAGVLVHTWFSVAPVPEMSIERGKTSAENIRLVDFKTKPNVYFIGFDSIIPKVILQKHLGIETTPYHEVFDAHFRRFRNFFADRTLTYKSLNSLLALDIGHFSDARRNDIWTYFFPGLIPSPLFEIFKYNGYETSTLYRSYFFGKKKGQHVDNYYVNSWDMRFGACEFIDTWGFRAFTFMGYCSLAKLIAYNKLFRSVLGKGVLLDQVDFLIDNMRDGLQKDTPQILVGYIYSPGHTDSVFDKNDTEAIDKYRKFYLKQSKKTAEYLNKIVTFIAEEDPEAILYVFGDHGPYISRGVTFEEDGAFFVQDRYGVYGGIYPHDRCAESFAKPYNKNFMTVSQGAHMIIRCLSGGENAFFELKDYRLPEFEAMGNNRYEDYLYE